MKLSRFTRKGHRSHHNGTIMSLSTSISANYLFDDRKAVAFDSSLNIFFLSLLIETNKFSFIIDMRNETTEKTKPNHTQHLPTKTNTKQLFSFHVRLLPTGILRIYRTKSCPTQISDCLLTETKEETKQKRIELLFDTTSI